MRHWKPTLGERNSSIHPDHAKNIQDTIDYYEAMSKLLGGKIHQSAVDADKIIEKFSKKPLTFE